MKPFLHSALCFALLLSTVCAGPVHAAEGGKEKAGLTSETVHADAKAFAAAEAL
jgi:hypothetical protein